MIWWRWARASAPANRFRPVVLAVADDCAVTTTDLGTATGADVAARPSFATRSCAGMPERPAPNLTEDEIMTITPELEAQILRYHHVEKWRVNTIARQLHVHHGTVARVLAQAALPRIGPPARHSQVEPYLPFIHQTLEKFPTLTASRLYAMVCERGYRGSGDHFRHLIACYRPRPAAE